MTDHEATPETLQALARGIALGEEQVVQPNRHMLALADILDAHATAWGKREERLLEVEEAAKEWGEALSRILDRSLRIADGRVDCTAFSHADYIMQVCLGLSKEAKAELAALRRLVGGQDGRPNQRRVASAVQKRSRPVCR